MRTKIQYLFTISNAYFYQIIPGTFSWFQTTQYYWKQQSTTEYHGPFSSIQFAVNSYQAMQSAANKPVVITEVPPNLIMINFYTKKRIKLN